MRDFEAILSKLAPRLEELEADRRRCRRASAIYLAVLLGPLTVGVSGAIFSDEEVKIYFMVGSVLWLVFGFVLYSIKAGSLAGNYRDAYKSAVIPRLLTLIDPSLRHSASSGISKTNFVETELFSRLPDRYVSEDLIEGNYGSTFLRLAEVHAEERHTTTDSDGKTQTRYVTIFKGILLLGDFHKHFQGRTFVFPDVAEKVLGNFGRVFQKLGGRSATKLIRLEDLEFEAVFAVYSTDEIEARYLLSTAMMERIMRMRERFGKEIRIGFKDSNILLAVPYRERFLEPELGIASSDEVQISKLLGELRMFLEVVEELDLNTRIWSKS